jgi:hypothetical protein
VGACYRAATTSHNLRESHRVSFSDPVSSGEELSPGDTLLSRGLGRIRHLEVGGSIREADESLL